ncbi:uncharacterized protein LOC121380154 isoform X1 [Gigantopelta aegis]|uniref:uncharacterized protein LOC121380154 isoform X1 n=1 Tax=Gigantopelta aegis TaxID=1735272 RepID=UPI001B889EBD|nr:uncharacterized protein LOC121380154 isoform X1 [Gigantopelta aegis]
MTARQSSDKRYSFSYPKDEIIPTIANLELQYVHLQQVFIMLRQDYENSKHYLPGARYKLLKAMVKVTLLKKNMKRAGYFVQPYNVIDLNKELRRMSKLERAQKSQQISNLRDKYLYAYIQLYKLQRDFKGLNRVCCSRRYQRLKMMIKRIIHDDVLMSE